MPAKNTKAPAVSGGKLVNTKEEVKDAPKSTKKVVKKELEAAPKTSRVAQDPPTTSQKSGKKNAKVKEVVKEVVKAVVEVVKDKKSKKKAEPVESNKPAPVPESKSQDVDKKSKRKVNMNPTLAEKAGINISVARVKNIVDSCILNKAEHDAAQEVRRAQGSLVRGDDGVELRSMTVPVSSLSQETQDIIQKAKRLYDRSEKEVWDKTFVGKMDAPTKERYMNERKVAKDLFEFNMRTVPEFERDVFDIEGFNLRFDKNFYQDFVEPKSDSDEWVTALGHLSKLRVRFSANSKILVSAFIEYLVQQLATNGTYNCIKGKKKIIKLSHALNFSDESRVSLHPLIANTKAYRKYQASRSDEDADDDTPEDVADPDDADEADASRPNFRFYVSEICRDVRMKLAGDENSAESDKVSYNLTNVGRDFKDFCNDLIFETIAILGKMVLTEINTRGVKTLNDVIMKTVIEHLHSAYGMDFKPSLQFIEHASNKYVAYVKQRRETRKAAPDGVGRASDEDE